MTYIEIIVVLSIFAVLSTVVMFNYGAFQSKIDIKNLASDIALKIVEAQKSSSSGKQPLNIVTPADWKPSYGVYFNSTETPPDTDGIALNKKFIYFADVNPVDTAYTGATTCTIECLGKILIGKGNKISEITRCTGVNCPNPTAPANILSHVAISFSRTKSAPVFYSQATLTGFEYVRITVTSPKGNNAYIKIYNSGRIQVN